MQKKLIALAVAALAGSAFAQTNVTIYGIADVGVAYTDGQAAGKNQWNISSGVLSTSRLGFRGTEDLGNGLKALFTLEYALAMDANQTLGYSATNASTARQQFVGLTGGFGTVIAGHLQTAGLDFIVASSALGGSASLGATNVVSTGTSTAVGSTTSMVQGAGRASNAVAYVSPNFNGLTLAYNHARVTEAALGTTTNDAYANLVGADYVNGPMTAGLVYSKISMANTAPADDITEIGVRGGYDFGVAKVQGAYQQYKDAAISIGKDKKYVVSATVPLGKFAVIGEFAKLSRDTTAANDDVKAFVLAGTYSLSKRTTAYAGVTQRNPAGSSNNVTTYAAGLRHSF